MRKAIIICAGIALITGVGSLLAWKIVNARSGDNNAQKTNYAMAAVTDGTDFGTADTTAKPQQVTEEVQNEIVLAAAEADAPVAVTAPPTDDQPIAVAVKPDDTDMPVAVAAKPLEDQPAAVTAPPESEQPAAVTTKPADEQPVAVAVTATPTETEVETAVVEEPVAVEETVAEVVEIAEVPATQPVEVVEVEVEAAEPVAVEDTVAEAVEIAEVPAAPPAEDKTVVLEEIAEAVTDKDAADAEPAKPVEIAAPAEIETAAEPAPAKVEPVAVATEGELKLEPVEAVEVVEVAVEAPVEATAVTEPVATTETAVAEETEATPYITPVEERIDTTKTIPAISEKGWKKPIPITFSIDYTMATDYIFRGINFSEYRRSWGQAKNEGREKLNHQLTAGAELNLQKFGRVGYNVWFNWYGGQSALSPEDGHKNLQEVDHTIYYGYNIEKIGLDLEVGFIWYMFPRTASGDGSSTQEIYLRQTIDDSLLWRAIGFKDVKKPILNPYIYMAWDLDLARGGMYSEFGMSHPFVLSELGMKNTPIIKDITITPTWSMGWDKNWLNKMSPDWARSHPAGGLGNEGRGRASNSSHLDFMNWGLEMNFDLKGALSIPDRYCGEMYLKGFLNYSDAIATQFLNDEFYGGMSVGFSW